MFSICHVTLQVRHIEGSCKFMSGSSSRYATTRGGSRTAATSKMERFVTIVNGWKLLTIITKRSIFDVAAALDPSFTTLTSLVAIVIVIVAV